MARVAEARAWLAGRVDGAVPVRACEALIEADARIDVLERTLLAVNDNALAWHGNEAAKARALNVIAVWSSEALAGRLHPSVEKIAKLADALNYPRPERRTRA